MSVVEVISVATAVVSVLISLYLIFRDKKQSKVDLLMTFYDRLQDANSELQLCDETDSVQKLRLKVDSELETACFMLFRKKIDEGLFYHLYNNWLMSRYNEIKEQKDLYKHLGNHYTIWAIKHGFQKHYLPEMESENFLKEMTSYAMDVANRLR